MNADVSSSRPRWWPFAIIAAEIIALNILWAPVSLSFSHFAFCDNGANLSLQYLVSHGYRPAVDFAYPYGLLSVLFGQLWFSIVGTSPLAFQTLVLCLELGMGLVLTRIIATLRLGTVSLAIVFVTLWFAIHTNYPSIAHAFEALLLILALHQQACGQPKRALIFAGTAVFVKPSMGYVYLAWLGVLWFLRNPRPERFRRLLPEVILPAAIISGGCAIVSSALYGPQELVRTVFPFEGVTVYNALNHGFFNGSGRLFWGPSYNSLGSYSFGVAGLWILATLFLVFAALGAACRLWSDPNNNSSPNARDEVILTCFVLHATFVCLFFGNQWSWFYYSYFLVIGVAVAADVSITGRRIGLAVCCIGVLSLFGTTLAVLRDWKTQQPRAATAWLWSPPAEAAEWNHVLELTRNVRATILDTKGAAELMYPQFQPPVSLFLDRGLMLQSEIQRKILQLGDSDMVVVPINIATCSGIPDSPEIRAAMQSFEPVFGGEFFDVYRRASSGAGR
jgi:hypothetical protein